MGYTTDFTGQFELNKPLDNETYEFLKKFADTRHMVRRFPQDIYGIDGEFYVEGSGFKGQDNEANIVNYNIPPTTQPGLWCQWVPSDDRFHIEWDGGEKFYEYTAWLEYIIKNFLAPKGYILNGEVEWQGEDFNDFGKLIVVNNTVLEKWGKKTYD